MFEQPRFRSATPANAEPMAALAERTFRDTFADDNSTDDIEAYVRHSFSLDRIRDELTNDANTFLLAFMDGEEHPDGYAKLRTGASDPSVTGRDPVELQRLYVDPSGVGHSSLWLVLQLHNNAPGNAETFQRRRLMPAMRHIAWRHFAGRRCLGNSARQNGR